MHPQLITGLPIQTFGLCIAIGVLAGWKVLNRLAAGRDLGNLVMLLIFCGIVGARLAHVCEYYHDDGFDRDPISALYIWRGGLVFYGGLIAAIAAFLGWCAARKENVLEWSDRICVALPLSHAFGRIGCFFYGCCWGKVSNGPLAVRFPCMSPAWHEQVRDGILSADARLTLPVLPTQLISAAALLVLFAVLWFVYRSWRGYTAALYFTGYAIIRFAIEFLRDDDRPAFYGLSSAQIVSIAALAAGIGFWLWSRHRRKALHG